MNQATVAKLAKLAVDLEKWSQGYYESARSRPDSDLVEWHKGKGDGYGMAAVWINEILQEI